jgi:pSer/pThr/pTyr-binding forkhead associated (FHA) protein
MSEKKSEKKPELSASTKLDPALGRPRLKEGLIPPDTGIFLKIEVGNGRGRVFTLSAGGVYLIGRDGADIVLEDEKVSRKHAEIGLYGPGAFTLRDLASTNGTRLNGRKVADREMLNHWDLIQLGDTSLRFAVVEGAIAVPRSA